MQDAGLCHSALTVPDLYVASDHQVVDFQSLKQQRTESAAAAAAAAAAATSALCVRDLDSAAGVAQES